MSFRGKGEIVRRCPGWNHVTWRGRWGVGRGKKGGAGETTVRLRFSCPHPHILPTLLQLPPHPAQPGAGNLGGGHSPRTQVRRPFPTSFSSRVGRLPFALGLAPGTLALSLGHSSANTVLDTSLHNSAPHPAPAQSGTCSVPDQSPIPGLAQLSIDN